MSENKLSKDWLKQNGQKLKLAYSYAVVNKLDIKSKEDVLKILKAVDPKNANPEQVQIYSKMLLLFGYMFRKTIKEGLED